jgi:hypothetical protein
MRFTLSDKTTDESVKMATIQLPREKSSSSGERVSKGRSKGCEKPETALQPCCDRPKAVDSMLLSAAGGCDRRGRSAFSGWRNIAAFPAEMVSEKI